MTSKSRITAFLRQPRTRSANWAAVITVLVISGLAPLLQRLNGDLFDRTFWGGAIMLIVFAWLVGFGTSQIQRDLLPQPRRFVRVVIGLIGGVIGLLIGLLFDRNSPGMSSWFYIFDFECGVLLGGSVLTACALQHFPSLARR